MISQPFERRFYCCLQIFGGLLFVMSWFNQLTGDSDTASNLFATFLAALGVATALVATLYLEGYRAMARWCFYFWALQVPSLAFASASYRFFSGAEVLVGFDFTHMKLFLEGKLGIGIVARIEQEGPHAYLGINAIALTAALFFRREKIRKLTPAVSG